MRTIPEISPQDLQKELASEKPPKILDVRERQELQISRLPDVVNVPIYELPEKLDELDRDDDWVVVCRTGSRSAQATAYMIHQGFSKVRNLATGMNGFARHVDPSIRTY